MAYKKPQVAKDCVRLYENVVQIKARKGKESLWPKEYFKHDFKQESNVEVYGMPDGSLRIVGDKPLWKWFEYGPDDIRKDHDGDNPYPNEHSARLIDPKSFKKYRRINNYLGLGIHTILGIKNKKSHLQAIRFQRHRFTPAKAKAWLKKHKIDYIKFETAKE